MQETPIERLLPTLVERIQGGTDLKSLVAAGALANARTFGGEDYIGFHTMMALAPAYHMARELPESRQRLPVLKVLYRNTNRIQEHGGRASEVLHPVQAPPLSPGEHGGEALRAAVRAKDVERAEGTFAASGSEVARGRLQRPAVCGRGRHGSASRRAALSSLGPAGPDRPEHAHTLLRQSVRYCVKNEDQSFRIGHVSVRSMLPKLLDQYQLAGRAPEIARPTTPGSTR